MKRQAERGKAPADGPDAASAAVSAAADAERADRAAKVLRDRVSAYKTTWLQARIVERLENVGANVYLRLLLMFALKYDRAHLERGAAAALAAAGRKPRGGGSVQAWPDRCAD